MLHIEKIRAAQMLVPFRNRGINARRLNRRDDRGFFRMLAVDLDCSAELRESAFRGPEQMPDLECDRRVRRIEFEDFVRKG